MSVLADQSSGNSSSWIEESSVSVLSMSEEVEGERGGIIELLRAFVYD